MVMNMEVKSPREVQRLEKKKRCEMRCAIRQRDEHAQAVREHEFLKKFIAEYDSLHRIQNAMKRREDDICVQGAAESRKKKIYGALYRIEVEKSRRAHAGLVEFKSCIDHVRLGVQAQSEELLRRNSKES